jgi:hypothetical protein
VTDLILHKVLFLVILHWYAACHRGSIIVKICQLDTWSRSGNLKWLFLLLLLLASFRLFASLVEKSEIVLVFLFSSCIFRLSICLFPLLWYSSWRRRIITFSLCLFYKFYWNLRQSANNTSLTQYLTSVLFLWRLDEVCLLAKKLISLVSDAVFNNHRSCSSVFNSKHRIRSVIRSWCRWLLITLRTHYWSSSYTMRCSICCSRSIRSNFKSSLNISRNLLLKVVILGRTIAIQIIKRSSLIWCRMILVTFLKELISMILNQITVRCRCVIIQAFVSLEIVFVGVIRERWLYFFNWYVHLKMPIRRWCHHVSPYSRKALVIQQLCLMRLISWVQAQDTFPVS